MKIFTVFILVSVLTCISARAGTGSIDKRVYVEWSSAPYKQIVYIKRTPYTTCTGQYVARDIILTARHCVTGTDTFDNYEKLGQEYKFLLHDGRQSSAKLEKYGHDFTTDDWALLRITDPNFYTNDYFDVANKTEYLPVENVGFGYMRILSNDEIQQLKNIFTTITNSSDKHMAFDDILDKATSKIQETGIPELRDWDDSIPGYKLKADKTCNLVGTRYFDQTISTTCDSWSGNSGGGYFSGNTLYGICSKGLDSWDDAQNTDYAVSPKLYYSVLQQMKQTSPEITNTSNPDNVVNTTIEPTIPPVETNQDSNDINTISVSTTPTENDSTTPASETSDDNLNQSGEQLAPTNDNVSETQTETVSAPPTIPAGDDISQQELETLGNNLNQSGEQLMTQAENVSEMTDNEFLKFLGNVTEYSVLKDAYERAKSREQSLTSRLTTAAAMGGMGIGGMQAMSAMAEKSADEDAERDMRAYMATFRCDYGAGRNIQGGEKQIELPGGNALFELRTQYIALSSDLKSRKAALGIKPGIESEHIEDAANTGLYDDVSLGKTDGAYTSLSRAISDENGKDAAEWSAQKSATSKKLKTGGIAAGVGGAVGLAGNIVGEVQKTKDEKEIKKK